MKQKRMTIIALVCGVACAACVALFMGSVQSQAAQERAQSLARYGGEQVEVCVASRDIAAGETLDASSVETKLWVSGLLPDEAMLKGENVLGQTATTSIFKGEVIVAKRFQKHASDLDIPAGLQAVSVPVKAVQAVGGNISQGMRVNVYSTGDAATTKLVSDALVLDSSVGEAESLSSSNAGWITLAVEPGRVQEIVAASSKTSLYFVIPGEQSEQDAVSSESKARSQADGASKPDASSSAQQSAAAQQSSSARQSRSTNERTQGSQSKEKADD